VDLDALALAEALTEMRAGGDDPPRVSDLLAAWPETSDEVVGAVTDAALAQHEELADAQVASVADAEYVADDGGGDVIAPGQFSAGTQRALDGLFGGQPGVTANAPKAYKHAETLAWVAETPAAYAASEPPRLLELAQARGLSAEALAAQLFLPAEVIDWLAAEALPRALQPDALVAHLVGALGIEREVVCRALAHGDGATEASAMAGDVLDRILADPSLTPAQRAYWQDMLS
jgi:hypothetical protein